MYNLLPVFEILYESLLHTAVCNQVFTLLLAGAVAKVKSFLLQYAGFQ